MSGDFGPHCIVPAALACLAELPSLHVTLVGQAPLIETLVARYGQVDQSRLKIVDAADVIGMEEKPSHVLRHRPKASMRVALEQVRDGLADACVSAGNSGALMALSRQILKTLPGIDRPAMAAIVPTEQGSCWILDLGANVDCSPHQLLQFAVMGAVVAQLNGVNNPRVRLLNVGVEEIKGNQLVRQAAALLDQQAELNYQGFIEGDGVYRGLADVVVCDGFTGNVWLKSSEGLASRASRSVREVFSVNWSSRLMGYLVRPWLRRLQTELAPERYNGASLLGLHGVVIKSHGAAGEQAFVWAIRRAVSDVQSQLPQRLGKRLADIQRA